MGQAETREMIQRAIQRGDARIRVVNGEEEDEEEDEYMLESEDDYDDVDEEVGNSSPLTESYYKVHAKRWPIDFKPAPDNKEIHLTQANLQLGEQLLSAFQTDTDPSQQEQQLATASRLFYACLTEMQFRASSIASRFRILSQVGLLITFFKQIQLTAEGNEAGEGEEKVGNNSDSKVQRLDQVIIDLSREPGLSWYFSQQTPQPHILLQLYSYLWSRLQPTSSPLLLPLLTEVLESEYKIPTLDSTSVSASSSNTVLSRLQDEIDHRFRLLRSGAFGTTALSHSNTFSPSSNVHTLLRGREIRNYGFSPRLKMTAAQTFIPHSKSRRIIGRFGPSAGYCGQFSLDGSLFYGAWKDWTIRLFDTSQLSSYNASANHFKLKKTIHTEEGNWTITDCQLSSDNRFLIYSSIIPQVYLCRLDEDVAHQQLEFARPDQHFFGIWSIRLSADNREVVCGTNRNTIGVYDLEANRLSFDARAHDDDVNAVCFLEEGNSHVFAR
jgi:hypothetical protein